MVNIKRSEWGYYHIGRFSYKMFIIFGYKMSWPNYQKEEMIKLGIWKTMLKQHLNGKYGNKIK